jgi:shikimate kinase
MEYVGMDARIVEKAGMSVPEIVEQNGWPGFRDIESEVAREYAVRDNLVIDTGGGVTERPENIEALRANGRIYWLKASVSTIVSRIQGDTERPSLTGQKSFTDEVTEVLERRTPIYQASAEHQIDTDSLTPVEVAEHIAALLGKSGSGDA